jgi:tRNA pseudouridine13 synthase
MLKHLVQKSDDFVGAFRRLPIKLRKLFTQAYQSYLFNKFLSGRVSAGLPLEGVVSGDYAVSLDRSGLPMATTCKIVGDDKLKEINDAIQAGKMQLALPLFGFKQNCSQGLQGEVEKRIICEENVSQEDFRIRVMPEISTRGELRTALTLLHDFSLSNISPEPANPSRCRVNVRFMLNRGSYATVVLRELMKTRDPIKTGF